MHQISTKSKSIVIVIFLDVQPTQARPDGMDFFDWATGCGYNPAGRQANKCKLEPRVKPLCLGFLVMNACKISVVEQYQMFVQESDTTSGVWKNLVKIFYAHPGSMESGGGVKTYTGINDKTILDTALVGNVGGASVEHVKDLFRTIMVPVNLITEQTQPHPVKLKYVNFFVTIIRGTQKIDWLRDRK